MECFWNCARQRCRTCSCCVAAQRNHGPWHSHRSPEYTAEISRRGWRTNVCYERPSQPSLICNAHGKFSFSARIQAWLWSVRGFVTKGSRTRRFGSLPTSQGSEAERERARELASLPLRMGGLGLRSMSRCSRAAYWASWADAVPMIQERNPAIAEIVEDAMVHNVFRPEGCLSDLAQATSLLDREGSAERPIWSELHRGMRPPTNLSKESSVAPTAPEFVVLPHLFRVWLLERMRLLLPITEATCGGCCAPLDPRGLHRAACTRPWRLKKRATPVERMLARVFRESGARVRFKATLEDVNVGASPTDDRRVEVLAGPSVIWRIPVRSGRHIAQLVAVLWRTSTRCSRHRRRDLVTSWQRQGNHLS